jgi:hypothetical protein
VVFVLLFGVVGWLVVGVGVWVVWGVWVVVVVVVVVVMVMVVVMVVVVVVVVVYIPPCHIAEMCGAYLLR